ncbi:MAG TPA: hypothetical protein VN698_09455 [Bacteroidia bacterium]|nr:hypothetical protein [Bacteroidia bacterium]
MDEPTTFEQETKPQGLKILCTLTFIYSGILGTCFLLFMLMAKPFFIWLNDNYPFSSLPNMTEEKVQQLKVIMDIGSTTFIIACGICLLIIGLSFFGALQMWHNKYKGFIMYVIANGLFLITKMMSGNYLLAVIDLLFIILYFRHSKSLEK